MYTHQLRFMETHGEFVQDVVLAVAFAGLALVAGYRSYLYFSLQGSGKVVTLFYTLIFMTSFARSLWFALPSEYLEGDYLPRPVLAFGGDHWEGILLSETLLSLGTLCLYAVFILLITFWANMLHKVEQNDSSPDNLYQENRKPRGPLETFSLVMLTLLLMEGVNIMLFLLRVYDAEIMILYDSSLFAIVSLSCLYGITFFSSRIRVILQTLGFINARSTKQQVQRIMAITLASNVFFMLRVCIEVGTIIVLVVLFLSEKEFSEILKHSFWSKCILCKHWLEFCIVSLELIVSSSVSNSPSDAAPKPQSSRRNNKPRRETLDGKHLSQNSTSILNNNGVGNIQSSNKGSQSENTPLLKQKGPTRYSL